MNGQVKVVTHILQDGTAVVSVNGNIIPNIKRISHTLSEGIEQVTLIIRDTEYSVRDDRSIQTEEDRQRLVEEAWADGRIIECIRRDDPHGDEWAQIHPSGWQQKLDWINYDFRLVRRTK